MTLDFGDRITAVTVDGMKSGVILSKTFEEKIRFGMQTSDGHIYNNILYEHIKRRRSKRELTSPKDPSPKRQNTEQGDKLL